MPVFAGRPARPSPDHDQGPWFSHTGMLDECRGPVFLTTTTPWCCRAASPLSNHGEGVISIRDYCNLTLPEDDGEDAEPRPTLVFNANLDPTHGPTLGSRLASATYQDTREHETDEGSTTITVDVTWSATGPLVKTQDADPGPAGTFISKNESRAAEATIAIDTGTHQISATTDRAEIWTNSYLLVG
ncbi:MAG: hypothetical protein IPL43_06800 [Micropruina sp.]|nr:hypothetical protein [Micropruina sp.]